MPNRKTDKVAKHVNEVSNDDMPKDLLQLHFIRIKFLSVTNWLTHSKVQK